MKLIMIILSLGQATYYRPDVIQYDRTEDSSLIPFENFIFNAVNVAMISDLGFAIIGSLI